MKKTSRKIALLLCTIPFAASFLVLHAAQTAHSIKFEYKSIPFQLENDETPGRNAPESMAGGVAVFDYNGDGRPDIFFANGANIATLAKDDAKYSDRLFRNDGNGVFTDVTKEAGLTGIGYDIGVAAGDYDNDGHEDLFLAGVHRNTLYHNNGNGTFTDVTAKAGLDKSVDPEFGPLWSVAAAWVDVNNDGLLDLFVVNYMQWTYSPTPLCSFQGYADYCHPRYYKGQPNQLFLNNGNGTFTDVSKEWGIREHVGKGMGVGVADYDVDGKPDLFVPNDAEYNSLFHNTGKKFEEVAFDAGVALAEDGGFISGMGLDFRDFNNDGYPDIAYVALVRQTFPLYQNTGKGEFTEVTSSSGMRALTMQMSGFGVGFYDFDNDVCFSQPRPNRKVDRIHSRWGLHLCSGSSPSRLRLCRSGRRRPRGCRRDRARQARGDLDESQREIRPLARRCPARHKEQSRRHRSPHQDRDQERPAVQPHDHQRRLCLIERCAGALRPGY